MVFEKDCSNIIPLRLEKLIGIGQEGRTYQAVRNDTNEVVAVKCILLDFDQSAQEKKIKHYQTHLQKIGKLDHPNLVRHIHCQRDAERHESGLPQYHIIMEFCKGAPLSDIVKTITMTPVLLRRWTRQLVEGIAYLHDDLHCVHRDIKGSNILLSSMDISTCQLKISDMGDMKFLRSETTQVNEVSGYKGTFAFMSPEIIVELDKHNVGRRTDIWSLGCVVVEMVTGRLPKFVNISDGRELTGMHAVMYFVAMGGSPVIPDNLPGPVADFIGNCLRHNPADRPSAVELKEHSFLSADDIITSP
ncbi:uncharacterized protein LOC129585381 [Paramacrobiotus metropolitanus]|uniref:uncharacterized protein LOC129585381 n=1 Tax=Paramacrobiotus metropolitanus TaxID=2943436 RepID=UPI002445ABB8|nr:uncharacterized protein LOC129585381 [Paramacrobiotus metropolitanus]